MSAFTPGADPRRNYSGRPPSPKTLAALIRRELGRDAFDLVQRVRVLALAGDPSAISAAAVLLAATIQPTTSK